jgi:hypothetical protein
MAAFPFTQQATAASCKGTTMRIRLAPTIVTSVVSLLFLFTSCLNLVFAQPGPPDFQPGPPSQIQIGPPGGIPLPPPPNQSSPGNEPISCSAIVMTMRYRPEGYRNDVVTRFFTADNYHWVEDVIPLLQDGTVRSENATVLTAFDRHDYLVWSCNLDHIVLYRRGQNVEDTVTSYFDLYNQVWYYYCGMPDRPGHCDWDLDGRRRPGWKIRNIVLRYGISPDDRRRLENRSPN